MADPRWLTEGEMRAWRGMLDMHARLKRHLTKQLQASSGLSEADYEVLVHLSEAPEGRLRAYELGRATQWEKSRLSHHLTRMEERGLIVRMACGEDKRGAFILLTEEGRKAIEAAAPAHVAQVRSAFIDVLTPAQLRTLAKISETVLDGLDADDACD